MLFGGFTFSITSKYKKSKRIRTFLNPFSKGKDSILFQKRANLSISKKNLKKSKFFSKNLLTNQEERSIIHNVVSDSPQTKKSLKEIPIRKILSE